MSPAGSLAGMDLEQVRDLARTMRRNAEHLDSVRHQLDATVRTLAWRGPDADALRHTWESSGRQALAGTAADLHRMSTALLAEVDQQVTASDQQGGSGHGASGPLGIHRPDPFGAIVSGVRHTVDHAVSWSTHGIRLGATLTVELWRWYEQTHPGSEKVLAGVDLLLGAALAKAEQSTVDRVPGLAVALSTLAAASGKPMPSFGQLAAWNALVLANLQGRNLDRPVSVTAAPTAPPAELAQKRGLPALTGLIDQAYGDRRGEDHVIVTKVGTDPHPRYIVAIPGTQNWGGESEHTFDQGNNQRLELNMPNSATSAVRQAMVQAGVPLGADVTLVGHSQGGMAAVRLVEDADFRRQYTVTHVATFGSPIDNMPIPSFKEVPPVEVLSVTAGGDVVPLADLTTRSQPGVVTVGVPGSWNPLDAHTRYQDWVRPSAHDQTRIDGFLASMDGADLRGATQMDATLHRSRTPLPALVGAP